MQQYPNDTVAIHGNRKWAGITPNEMACPGSQKLHEFFQS
jgi:hypothetical protein